MKKINLLFAILFACLLAGQALAQTPNVYTETISKKISFNMIYVEGGEFMMGSEKTINDDSKPIHRVELDGFYMAEFEVTQELWQAVMGDNPSHNTKCPKCPVELVSWLKAQEFVQKLNEKTGQNYSLPTEAQWEYAARGGKYSKGYKYPGSNNLDEVAHYDPKGVYPLLLGEKGKISGYGKEGTTVKVGTKKPNELGLYDMMGNVEEWCLDYYDKNFYSNPKALLKNPLNDTDNKNKSGWRSHRGGSYSTYKPISSYEMVAARSESFQGYDSKASGLRLVKTP